MSTQVIGNRPTYGHAPQTGSGIASAPIGNGHVTISGKTGDVVFVELMSLYPKYGGINFGVQAQAAGTGASIKIEATLATPDLAKDPAQGSSIWVVDTAALATGTMAPLKYIASVYKVTFTVGGTLFLMGA